MLQSLEMLSRITPHNLPKLTPNYSKIIHLLYRFRFLTSHQLQTLLHHKLLRQTNRTLHLLCSHNYLGKHYSKKLGAGNLPAIYFLAPASIKALQKVPDVLPKSLQRIYREKIRSPKFISHSVFIADYFLYLQTESTKTHHQLYFYTQTDLLGHFYLIQPLPSAYFARVDSRGVTTRFFVEVLDPHIPRSALVHKAQLYSAYFDSKNFETVTHHPFPILLLICPTLGLKNYLLHHFIDLVTDTSLTSFSIYVATQPEALAGKWEKATSQD